SRREPDEERGTGDLLDRRVAQDLVALLLLDRRQHELSGDTVEPDFASVVDEREAFVVFEVAFGDIGDEVRPVRAETTHQTVQGGEIRAHFLDSDEIESGNDLRDVNDRFLKPV